MRKQIVFAILLLSAIFLSFTEKNYSVKSLGYLVSGKKSNLVCGPAFDSIYNQHSSVIVSSLNCSDPLGNFIPITTNLGPGDNVSISASGSMCGYAGGVYEYFFNISNPGSNGSIQILDQFNNVVACQNITTKHLYHFIFNATCATTYKIVISNSSC